MTYENICNLKKGGFPKTFQDLSLRFKSEIGNTVEEPLTIFKRHNLNLYWKLKDFDYDKDAIASLITQVTLSNKLTVNTLLVEPILQYNFSNIITIPHLLLSSKDEDGRFYQHNTYIDIINYYYIVVNLSNPHPAIIHEVIDIARMILDELVHHNDKFKKVIFEKPTDYYIDVLSRRNSLFIEKTKHAEHKTFVLSFEKLASDLGVDDISVMLDFPVLPYTFNDFPFDRLKVIKFLSDYLYEPIVQNLELVWIDSIFLTPINILSDDATQQKDDYLDMINYYYKIENITGFSKKGDIKKLSYIIRSIRKMLQYHPNTFGTNINKNTNAVNSNAILIPVERKDNYSALFREVTCIRKDVLGQTTENPMFYKIEEINDSDIRYSISQIQDKLKNENSKIIVSNPNYKDLIIKSIKCNEIGVLKYEVKFGMKDWIDDSIINQSSSDDELTSNRYLILTYLQLNKDYHLTWINIKQDYESIYIPKVSYSICSQDTIQIEIEWPFGIASLNEALRNGYITFILTVRKTIRRIKQSL